MSSLPIADIYPEIKQALSHSNRLILQAPPGAGKSTWLPLQWLRDHPQCRILLLEPRRLAARAVAGYMAKQLDQRLGQSIGLISSDDYRRSEATMLTVVTEGVLTQMLLEDPFLEKVDLLIFDEFHERSIHADLGLALVKEMQEALRPELKLLLMSATLDRGELHAYLACPQLQSLGQSYPLNIKYLPLSDTRNEQAWMPTLAAAVQRWIRQDQGSALVFLPGQGEIRQFQALIDPQDVQLRTLHGGLSKTAQQSAIAADKSRRLILCTNIAETSLTIEGIDTVFDSLRKRLASYHSKTSASALRLSLISKAESIQRAGRAARQGPGTAYRIGEEAAWLRLPEYAAPQIDHSELLDLYLNVLRWGGRPETLDWLSAPKPKMLIDTRAKLRAWGVIDADDRLVKTSITCGNLRIDLAWLNLQKAQRLDLLPQLAGFAAWLSMGSLDSQLDISRQIQQQSETPRFAKEAKKWARKLNVNWSEGVDYTELQSVVFAAYPDRLGKQRGQGYAMSCGAGASWGQPDHPMAVHKYLLAVELGGVEAGRIYAAEPCNIETLEYAMPWQFSNQTSARFDEASARFAVFSQQCCFDLVLREQRRNDPIDQHLRSQAWLDYLRRHGLFKLFDAKANSLLNRLKIWQQHQHNHYDFDETALLDNNRWIQSYLAQCETLVSLKKLDFAQALLACIDGSSRKQLDRDLPLRFALPTGTMVAINYTDAGQAVASVRMQEVFGLAATPVFMHGKIRLILDLLSPAQRSLQRTADLAGFWQGSYVEVKKQMKGRYPKHYWPDDPATAVATKSTKKRGLR